MIIKRGLKWIKRYGGYIHVIMNDWLENPEFLWKYRNRKPETTIWCKGTNIIRHAGGEFEGQVYTNSLEAIKKSVQNGNCLIELDFGVTTDERVVLSHELLKEQGISYKKYMGEICGNFTRVDINMLLTFLENNPQIFIVVDIKGEEYIKVIEEIVKASFKRAGVLNRFIIQLYNFRDLEMVTKIYNFSNYILTLYASGLSICNSRKIIKYCLKNRIENVTMPKHWVQDKKSLRLYNRYKLKVWIHTVNDREELEKYRRWGVYGVYSDFLNVK